MKKKYETSLLDNGLRIIHLPNDSQISYCGVIVDVGSRDEQESEYGMAHFIEHMLFKGTNKRRSGQIINRLEDVGGEINAYTSKEETVVYAGFLNEYAERAIELIADLVQHSIFPQPEIDKEIVVIQDEIQLYNDSPSELIFDDFEEMLFNAHPMAHSVLGTKEHLSTFNSEKALEFYSGFYQPENMVFFSLGKNDFKKINRWVEKYFYFKQNGRNNYKRTTPKTTASELKTLNRETFQSHCLMGARAYNIHHRERLTLYMLNNILGGPGMNSRLNLSLRENNGLVYNVESTVQTFTDCGWWGVYFGTDHENVAKCEKLVRKELQKLCTTKISDAKLKKYKLQLLGQMAISSENKESVALSLGKSYLRFGKYESNDEIRERIESITAERLMDVAGEIFDVENLTILKYTIA
ncbi:MAG: insulinase family protein [Porphyromonadaceae bacterium]|nr:insulinase family protein [Porphyromonadaceae bacterium]